MPRIRTIKPDAFLSESLCEVPRATRWTFAGLWTYADDAGRGRDDARLIKAALYPLDDEVTLDDVKTDLWLLTGIGAVCRYIVDGRNYLHMPNWHHQKINRPTPPKSPPCPLHEDGGSGHVLEPDDSLRDHGVLTEASTWEGKGREGKGSGKADKPAETLPDRFGEFWEAYGYKVKRADALKAWGRATKKASADQIITSAAAYSAKVQADKAARGDRATEQAHASTWLNGERWDDEDAKPRSLVSITVPEDHEAPPDGLDDQAWLDWDADRRRRAADHRAQLARERGLA